MSDYTEAVARALADHGDEVHVWARGNAHGSDEDSTGVKVHRVAGKFGLAGLSRLDRELDGLPGPRTILIQYVPHAFGWKAMNLPFAVWVAARRIRRRDDIRVMFHEVAFPWVGWPLHHNIVAAANRMMGALLLMACNCNYVSSHGWEPLLRRLGTGRARINWLPVPSNVPEGTSADTILTRRAELTQGDPDARLICHFGTYSPSITKTLGTALRQLLSQRPKVRILLLGAGGDRWLESHHEWPRNWLDRVIALGPLQGAIIGEYLKACDLVLQPYPDGVSGRRSTLMAALINGKPVVTTIGALSEPIWSDGAVATVPAGDPEAFSRMALDLLDRPDRLAELGRAGRQLYEDRFALRHTVATLLDPP